MLVVAELDVRQLEFAAPLDIDLLRTVDHDVVDGLVGDQRLKGPQAQHVRDQRVDELALFDEIQLDLGFDKQLLDPAGELRFEGGARHFRGRRNVHMFQDEGLDLCFGGFHRRPTARQLAHARGAIGRSGRPGRRDQRLHDVGDEVASGEWVRLDRMAHEIRLHRAADELRQITAAQQGATLRPDLSTEPRHQFFASDREMLLKRSRRRRGLSRSRDRSCGVRQSCGIRGSGWNRWSGGGSRRHRCILRRRRRRGLLHDI